MKANVRKGLAQRKRKIEQRLARPIDEESPRPVFAGTNAQYELADRDRGIAHGGIGLIHRFSHKIGLIDAIDKRVHLLKFYLPYHESDHVLNIAYNALCGGTCLDDIELRRNDEVHLDALGADRIPDPTTAGDFCRRFDIESIDDLQCAINEVRLGVWKRQPKEFFREAILDMDGTLVSTTGKCKEGMDISYKGEWGYHPLLVTLANTGEPLLLVNRPGNRPSHEGAFAAADDAIELCRRAGFRKILLRGDTDFTQTEHLDRWSQDKVRFIFGVDAMPKLVDLAENLPETAWKRLVRRKKPPRKTERRRRPAKVKEKIVVERGFKNLRLVGERIASFSYRPGKCQRDYRIVVVHKRIQVEQRGVPLIEGAEDRFLFYITNEEKTTDEEIVFGANDRCDQENIIEQLKNGPRALTAPVDNLESNWAYMVMASLAWSLKAWMALWLPEPKGKLQVLHRADKRSLLRMEFKRFVNVFVRMPALIVRSGRRLIYRLLSWNPWQPIFFRLYDALRC